MKRRALIITAAVLLGLGAGQGIRGAASPEARRFPREDLPEVSELLPGEPLPALDISATQVAAALLNDDGRADLLAIGATGELRAFLNVAGTRPSAEVFARADFTRSLGGPVEDLFVTDLDGDGRHDLAFLVAPPPELRRQEIRATVTSADEGVLTVEERLEPGVLAGETIRFGQRSYRVRSNGEHEILLEGTGGLRGLALPGSGVITASLLTRANVPARLAVEFAAGGGSFVSGDCLPALSALDGRRVAGVEAADADQDGTVDLLLKLAPVWEGKVASVAQKDGIWTLSAPGARLPQAGAGLPLIPDIRDERTFSVRSAGAGAVSFAAPPGASIAAAGSYFRIEGPADQTVVLRGLGERCFAPAWEVPRPVYAARVMEEDGKRRVVITDPSAALRPADAFAGKRLRLGAAPLRPEAPAMLILRHSATEIVIDPGATEISAIRGIVDGGAPSLYAIVPDPPAAPGASLPNARSTLTLPPDHASFRPPGASAPLSGAAADFTGDLRPDLVIAAGQLFLQRGR